MRLPFRPVITALTILGTALVAACAEQITTPSDSPAISLVILSGNLQTGTVGLELAQPLLVQATDSKGKALPNVVVTFRVTKGGGTIYAGSAITDAKGNAADYWTLGTSTAQAQEVEVRAVLPTGEKQVYGVYTANPLPGPATAMSILNGRYSQWRLAGTAVRIKPSVKITDQYGNPVGGVGVTFAPTSGGGTVNGGSAITSAQGIAEVGDWTLGSAPGPNTLAATAPGLAGSPVAFGAIGNSGALYVANQIGNSVTVYAAGSAGNVAPIATIQGSNTGLSVPHGIAIDGSGNLHVVNSGTNTVTTFSLGANGNVTPLRTISGASTGLTSALAIATDIAGNLYVTNQHHDNIVVFAAGANGNVAPMRTISGANTGLSRPTGIVFDSSENLYVINLGIYGNSCCNSSVTAYAPGASGNATPIKTIGGSNTGMLNALGIVVDRTGTIHVSNFGNTDAGPSTSGTNVVSFASGLTGNVTPTRTILGAGTLSLPLGVAIDNAEKLFVANYSTANSVSVYAPDANGNAAPVASIAGSSTGLNKPAYLTF